ncbi:MAG: DUF3106 domain-containing protein [Vicinamibacteria bacterium]|jgi:hypothetical protein|nr:DUF3106 domain-containing protein [Vicinamibacteria bacterium]
MLRRSIGKGIVCVLLAALLLLACGFVVMGLWNWLLPALFGWPAIGFWQALGLLVLSKILFGSFHCGSMRHEHGHWRHRMAERYANMTPEEREKFSHGVSGCC